MPLTAQTFAVLLAGAALGSIRGILSMLLYTVVGLVGVPWFAEGSSGFSMPSFGYILGFIAGAGLVGWLAEQGLDPHALDTALAMVLGNVVIYAIGVPWLKVAMGATWAGAVQMGMTPSLIGDGIKIVLAAGLFPLLWRLMTRNGLAPRSTTTDSAVIDLTDKSDKTAVRSDQKSTTRPDREVGELIEAGYCYRRTRRKPPRPT